MIRSHRIIKEHSGNETSFIFNPNSDNDPGAAAEGVFVTMATNSGGLTCYSSDIYASYE